MPASGVWARGWRFDGECGGKRKVARVGSGNGVRLGREVCGREGNEIPRVSASMSSSRAVITQSVSRTGACADGGIEGEEGRQYISVSSSREASSFLSKQGMMATCQIWSGRIWSSRLRIVLRRVPVRACGDLRRER